MKKVFIALLSISIALFSGCKRRSGTDITITNKFPERIISLSPASTEILFAVGASNQIAAVSEFSNYPEQAKELPRVGGFDGKTLSMEKILSFDPDFVYLTKGMHDFLIPQLEQFHIRYYLSNGDSIESLENEILDIANITGHKDQGEPVVKAIENQFSLAKTIIQNSQTNSVQTKIYWEIWHEPFISIGKNSFLADLLRKCGLINIFDDLDQPYPQVSIESILARNPDFIVVPSQNSINVAAISKRPGWEYTTAVQKNNILIVDADLFSQPGPRIGECAERLCQLITGNGEK